MKGHERQLIRFSLQRAVRFASWLMIYGQLLTSFAQAATYYMGPSGNDSTSCSGAQNTNTPKLSLSSAKGCLSPGDTLLIQDGTYTGATNNWTALPSGSAVGGYITFKAQNDGGVVFATSFSLDHTNAYLRIEGLRFDKQEQKDFLGNHIKVLRTGFNGGCPSGNCSSLAIGTNDFNDTADILLEDSWVYGPGGRYNIVVFNADHVVLRRVVIRHDGAWTDTKGDPEAGLNFYNSSDSWCENCIILDSNLTYHTWAQAYYIVHNVNSGSHLTMNNGWIGSMALNNVAPAWRFDTDGSGHMMTDCAAVDTTNGGVTFGQSGNNVTVNRMTILRKNTSYSGDFRGGFGFWGSGGNRTVTNTIIANLPGSDLDGVTASYFDTYNNGSTSGGTGRVTFNPLTNGLSYVPRIEAGSTLKTAGSSGQQIGAQILSRIGTSGTLFGEVGWNADTGQSLWPWPNEDRIKKEMCTDAGVTRGFCSAQNLTRYIWEYLGNSCPEEICSGTPPPDTTPPVISGGQPTGTQPAGTTQVTLRVTTNEAATCKYDATSRTYPLMANTFSSTGGTSHSSVITGLANGSSYVRYVRCQDAAGNANASDYQIAFSVNTPGNNAPVVSAITANPPDVDPSAPGVQEYENTSVIYSGTASDADGNLLTWQWIYTLNGGPEVLFRSGSGSVQPVIFSYPAGVRTYEWILRVNDGIVNSESRLTIYVIAQGNTTPPGGSTPHVPDLSGIDNKAYTTQDQILLPPPPSGDTVTGYLWSLNKAGSAAGSKSRVLSGVSAVNNFGTSSGVLGLAPFGLDPGRYTLSVQAQNGTLTSPAATAGISVVQADLNTVKVFPNPWKKDKHDGHDITFDNLTANSTVKIFTISGHLVRELPAGSVDRMEKASTLRL